MITIADALKTAILADSAAAALLTGGVFTREETGPLGVTRNNTPTAFDATTGLLKPCLLIKVRSSKADGVLFDVPQQKTGIHAVVECWFYDDTAQDYDTIRAARDAVYTVIQYTATIPNLFGIALVNEMIGMHDPALAALLERDDYEIRVIRS